MTEITAPGALPPIALTGATGFVGRRVVALDQHEDAVTRLQHMAIPGLQENLILIDQHTALQRVRRGHDIGRG